MGDGEALRKSCVEENGEQDEQQPEGRGTIVWRHYFAKDACSVAVARHQLAQREAESFAWIVPAIKESYGSIYQTKGGSPRIDKYTGNAGMISEMKECGGSWTNLMPPRSFCNTYTCKGQRACFWCKVGHKTKSNEWLIGSKV